MDKKGIILLGCGHFEKELTEPIIHDIIHEFNIPVHFKECILDISNFYNPGRRQYDANMIMKAVSDRLPPGYTKAVSMVRVDLFIPILTFIFGQATLNGSLAIASLYRLRNELYGLEKNELLLAERFRKVILHELGHTFGLVHCPNPVCIMRSSTYVEDIDQKEIHFCRTCRNELEVSKKFIQSK